VKTRTIRKVIYVCFLSVNVLVDAQQTARASERPKNENQTSDESKVSGESLLKGSILSIQDVDGLSANLDVKTTQGGGVGFDYKVEYERFVLGDQYRAGNAVSLDVKSQGFLATTVDNNQNSIISEFRLSGHLFFSDAQPLSPLEEVRIREILDLPNWADLQFKQRTPAEQSLVDEYDRLARFQSKHRFVAFDIHAKDESDQLFDHNQVAFGAGVSSDFELFTGDNKIETILDLPFSLLRPSTTDAYYKPDLIRFYFGYDYVANVQNTTDVDRLTFQLAWKTLVLRQCEFRISWQTYYELNNPEAAPAANNEFTSFLETSLSVPVDAQKNTKVLIKYTVGKLPPTLQQSSNASVGFSLSF
jgi:hypothetical protein